MIFQVTNFVLTGRRKMEGCEDSALLVRPCTDTRHYPTSFSDGHVWMCTQKFPDWPRGVRTANGTAVCHYLQLYRYFVSQSSEVCLHNPLCYLSTSVYFCHRIFCYDWVRKLLDSLSRMMGWVGFLARMEGKRNAYNILVREACREETACEA